VQNGRVLPDWSVMYILHNRFLILLVRSSILPTQAFISTLYINLPSGLLPSFSHFVFIEIYQNSNITNYINVLEHVLIPVSSGDTCNTFTTHAKVVNSVNSYTY
jgi:hypothetical protein